MNVALGHRFAFRTFLGTAVVIPLLLVGADPVRAGTAQQSTTSTGERCAQFTRFEPGNFSASTEIDNRFLPLIPGTQFVLEGRADRGAGAQPHTVVLTVTDLTKMIDGVRSRVLYDVDSSGNTVDEAELAFFAQDDAGNVWNLGEYPEEFEDGTFVGAPSTWITGQSGARGGVHMPGSPALGTRSYLQGSAPAVEFLDCAQIFQMGQTTCVPVQCYTDVLVTDEWSPLDRVSGHQRKHHAPGVGIVRVSAVDDPEGETLELTRLVKLSAGQLAAARRAALKLDARAYEISLDYRATGPAQQG